MFSESRMAEISRQNTHLYSKIINPQQNEDTYRSGGKSRFRKTISYNSRTIKERSKSSGTRKPIFD